MNKISPHIKLLVKTRKSISDISQEDRYVCLCTSRHKFLNVRYRKENVSCKYRGFFAVPERMKTSH
jgi:hypothetical protein